MLEKIRLSRNELPLLPKKTKINKEEKLITIKVSNLKDKEKYVVNLEIYRKLSIMSWN